MAPIQLQPAAESTKRSLGEAGLDENNETRSKRTRTPNGDRKAAARQKLFEADPNKASNLWRPIDTHCGMQSMFPGMVDDEDQMSDESTNDALAYLRSVRSVTSPLLVLTLFSLPCFHLRLPLSVYPLRSSR